MFFVRDTILVQRYRVKEALHHRVEEASVAPVLHGIRDALANLVYVRTLA